MKIGQESTLLKRSPPVRAERSSAHSLAPPIERSSKIEERKKITKKIIEERSTISLDT